MEFNFGSTYQPQQSMFGVQGLDTPQNPMDIDPNSFGAPGTEMNFGNNNQPPAFGQGSTMGQNFMGGVQAFNGLANAYMGYKNYGLAKDQLAENKKQFSLNFNTQAGLVNNQLSDKYAVLADSAKSNGNMNFGTEEEYLEDRGVRGANGRVVGA
jgi:hypothetical protein